MHLAILAGIVTTFVAASLAAAQPVSNPAIKTLGIVALAIAQVAVARAVTNAALAMKSPSRRNLWHLFRLRKLHIYLWLICSASILLVLQWPQIVQQNFGLGGMILVDEIITLLPILTPLLFSWAEFDRMDRTMEEKAEATGSESNPTAGWLARAQQYLVIPLAPLLLLTSTRDALRLAIPNWSIEHSSAVAAAFTFVVVAIALPFVIRFCWPTIPLERSSLRRRLEASATEARVRLLNVLIWSPGPNVLNAATTGYLPRLRYVLLSKGLVDQLDETELEAVFAHELAHIRRGHLYRLLVALSIPLLIGLATMNGQPSSLVVGLTTAFASFAYLVIVLGRYAKLLEHDADLWACQHLAKRVDDTSSDRCFSQESTTKGYIAALAKTAVEEERKTDDWLHPSLNDRFEFLQRAVSNEAVSHRFTSRLQRINILFMVLAMALVTIGICGS